jgi:hypothetical protein
VKAVMSLQVPSNAGQFLSGISYIKVFISHTFTCIRQQMGLRTMN